MAEVLFDSDGIRMWMDGASPVIFVKFSAAPPGKEPGSRFSKCQHALQHLIAREESVYSIVDISECTDKCALSLLQSCFAYFPQLLNEEIKYLAVVYATTHQHTIEEQVANLLVNSPEKKKGCFSDFFSALGKINKIRQRQFSINL